MTEKQIYTPSTIVRMIANLGDPTTGELRPNVNALALARKQGWRGPEHDQYIRLCVLLGRHDDELPDDVVDTLIREFSATRLTDRLEPVVLAMLSLMKRIPRDYPCTDALVKTFNRWTIEPETAWQARLYAGAFLNRLSHIDDDLYHAFRRHMKRSIIEWSLDYHTTYAVQGFDLRSRGMFSALLSVPWSKDRMENVKSGLDGAFNCCITKLMEATELDWFRRFLDDLAPRVLSATMHRRLTPQTLYDIALCLARARRKLYRYLPEIAIALTDFEEAIHRPHRMVLNRPGAPKLELELPGTRGFDGKNPLVLHDISADGCLAYLGGGAALEETDHASPAELDRRFNRTFTVWQHHGVIRHGDTEIPVHPGSEMLLHNGETDADGWAVDRASLVRYSHDPDSGRLWMGFHFDKVLPAVQRRIDELVTAEE